MNFSVGMTRTMADYIFRALVTKQNANLNTHHLHMEINKGVGL